MSFSEPICGSDRPPTRCALRRTSFPYGYDVCTHHFLPLVENDGLPSVARLRMSFSEPICGSDRPPTRCALRRTSFPYGYDVCTHHFLPLVENDGLPSVARLRMSFSEPICGSDRPPTRCALRRTSFPYGYDVCTHHFLPLVENDGLPSVARLRRAKDGGRYRTRTCDLYRVKVAF